MHASGASPAATRAAAAGRPAPRFPDEQRETRVAGGLTGAYLLSSAGPIANRRTEIRKYNGTNFEGAPVFSHGGVGYINDITVGPTGAVAGIWRMNEPSGGNRLKLALSGNGTSPYAVSTVARDDTVMASMDVSLAGDNGGFAVYEGNAGGSSAAIRMTDLSAVADPPSGDGGGSGGSGSGSGTPATPIVPPKPPADTSKPLAPSKTTTARVNGATVALGAPRGCIPAGRPFIATLTWKKQKRKGNLFVKVRRTDFFIDKTRLKIDRKAPFRQTLRIPSPRAGKTYKLRARAYIKMRRGRSPKKSITTTLRVCS